VSLKKILSLRKITSNAIIMKNVILPTISLLICVLCLISCNNTLLPVKIPASEPTIPKNDIVKEIPRYKENNKVYLFYKLAKQKQKQLDLVIPENGYDSLLLRLWFVYPENLHQYGEMVEIKCDSTNDIKATYTKMRIFFNPTRDFERINNHVDSIISIPMHGWTNFSNTLNRLDIVNLPTIEQIPQYNKAENGWGYDNNYMTVACEIATKNKYRFIQYNDFEKHKDIDEVARMYEFIRFLRSEFDMQEIHEGWYGKGDVIDE